jgi:hypothetical protein
LGLVETWEVSQGKVEVRVKVSAQKSEAQEEPNNKLEANRGGLTILPRLASMGFGPKSHFPFTSSDSQHDGPQRDTLFTIVLDNLISTYLQVATTQN